MSKVKPSILLPPERRYQFWIMKDPQGVIQALKDGADPNEGGFVLCRVLSLPRRMLPVVNALLDAGANPNAADPMGETPLQIITGRYWSKPAEQKYAEKVVAALLRAGADPNVNAPLLNAVCYPAILKLLLDAGADHTVRNREGMTALAIATDNRFGICRTANPLSAKFLRSHARKLLVLNGSGR